MCLFGFIFQLLPLFPLFQGEEIRDPVFPFPAGLCQPGDKDPSPCRDELQGHSWDTAMAQNSSWTGKIPAGNAPWLRSGAEAEFSSPCPRGREQEV